MMQLRLSVCPSLWGNNRLRDENGKGTIKCGSGWGCWGSWFGGMRESDRGRLNKHTFRPAAQHTFSIPRIFARGCYSLIVWCFALRDRDDAGWGVKDKVVIGVGWMWWSQEKFALVECEFHYTNLFEYKFDHTLTILTYTALCII